MLSSTDRLAILLTGLLLFVALIGPESNAGLSRETSQKADSSFSEISPSSTLPTNAVEPATPDALSSTSMYFELRADVRRCARPLCGGYWVRRVNAASTRCADGRLNRECYVAEADWNDQPEIDRGRRGLVRGRITPRPTQGEGWSRRLGIFRVTESWLPANDRRAQGIFYRVTDRNLRCITYPCKTHHAAQLNSTFSRDIAGVDFRETGASEELVNRAAAAMNTPDGVLVAGFPARVTGPAGRAETLKATQFYLRATSSVGQKPCMRTGCSSQVCADEPRVTTCEWRPEYACYQRARCERQPDGTCGFTRTPELIACLARN